MKTAVLIDLPDEQILLQRACSRFLLDLYQSGHQLKVITSYERSPTFVPKGIELIQPFRKWNFFEVVQVLNILLEMRADLVVIAPFSSFKQDARHGRWLWTLLPLIKSLSLGSTRVVFISDVPDDSLRLQTKALSQLCDQTFSLLAHSNFPKLGLNFGEPSALRPELAIDCFDIIIPSSLDHIDDLQKASEFYANTLNISNYQLLFLGGWGGVEVSQRHVWTHFFQSHGLNSRWKILSLENPQSHHRYDEIIRQGACVSLLHLQLSPLEKALIANHSVANGVPVLLDLADQAHVGAHSGFIFLHSSDLNSVRGVFAQKQVLAKLKESLHSERQCYDDQSNRFNRDLNAQEMGFKLGQ